MTNLDTGSNTVLDTASYKPRSDSITNLDTGSNTILDTGSNTVLDTASYKPRYRL